MSTELTTTPEFLDFAPARAVLTPRSRLAQVRLEKFACLGMPRTDPVNSYRTAKLGLVRWMDRRIRGDCADSDTAKPKAKLIGELLHTFLMTVRPTSSVRLRSGAGWT